MFTLALLSFLAISCVSPKVTIHKKMVGKDGVVQLDKQPEFVGGWDAYEEYFKKQLKYPTKAKINGTEGKVVVSFVVRKDGGTITDVEVVKSVSPEIDEEAIRLISNMPNWKPAIEDGKEVSVRMQIPLDFKL